MLVLLSLAPLLATIGMSTTSFHIESSKITSFFSSVKLWARISYRFEPNLLGLKRSFVTASLDVDCRLGCGQDLVPTFHRATVHTRSEGKQWLRHSTTHLRWRFHCDLSLDSFSVSVISVSTIVAEWIWSDWRLRVRRNGGAWTYSIR